MPEQGMLSWLKGATLSRLFCLILLDYLNNWTFWRAAAGCLSGSSVDFDKSETVLKDSDCVFSVPLHWNVCTSVPCLLNGGACMYYAQGWNVKINYLTLRQVTIGGSSCYIHFTSIQGIYML